ncbi:DegT/DnrJ/EryC1/StrS family aminotransferase [Acidobacteria bacterium AH-259-D05]|nr:DegT/DnrJ/EryC1/StrS family aminotransferase [Acidobacteria bacterium AH-259-D05]
MDFIPVCEPTLLGNEVNYVQDAVKSTWISSKGKYLDQFEEGFAEKIGRRYGAGTPNGTTALHLGLKALGIGPGEEVIIPTFTMIACGFSVCYTGAVPVFIDAEADTWNMNPELIEPKISERTKAIMIVHIYGHPADIDPIQAIANKYNLLILEDSAEAIGGEYKGKNCGSFGGISCFSFFANKHITTGEGGMVLTDSKEVYDEVRYLRNLAFPLGEERNYFHEDIGFNYRMSNLHAAIGLGQLEKLDIYVQMRRQNAGLYNKYLSDIEGITLPPEKEWAKNVYWMYGIVVDRERYGLNRNQLMDLLKKHGIGSRRFFVGMHRQPSLKKYGCECSDVYPVADWLAENGLYLPSSSHLTEEQIKMIAEVIRNRA